MGEILITLNQLEVIQNHVLYQDNFELAKKNWENFSPKQKESVVECLKIWYPEKAKLIKEASWYNTLGDIVGIFDPTGVVDLVNGISYIRQGDNLFGFLSLISAVPYIGDFVAKPVMGALKIGAPSAKALENVLKLSKLGKSEAAAKELARISSYGGITSTFVRGFGKVGTKLRGYIERAPESIFGGLKRTILQWFDLFEAAAKGGTKVRRTGQRLANRFTKLSPQLQAKNLENLLKLAKETPGLFTGYRTSKGLMSWKTLFGGMPQLMGRNKSVRALMRQTKWWAGFLDYIGIANFVGPEEISKQMGEDEFMKKMKEYQKTSQSQNNFSEDFGSENESSQTQQSTPSQNNSSSQEESQNPFANFLNKLLKNTINPLP